MLIVTTETLPPGFQLVESYGLLMYTAQVQVSAKGIIRDILERNRNEWEEVLQGLKDTAPDNTNVIYGVHVSTAVGQFKNGSYLYVTMTGTAGRYRETD